MLGRFLHGLPAVLLLTLLTVIVHKFHAFDAFDSWFTRQSVQVLLTARHELSEPVIPTAGQRDDVIQVVEVGTALRIQALEHDGKNLKQTELDRIGGVRPIDRDKLADLIEALAAALPIDDPKPAVVAIDIDVAPLFDAPCDPLPASVFQPPTPPRIAEALNTLREKVHVIVIAMSRPEKSQRRCRNNFMVRVGCTMSSPARVDHPRNGLYFASPRLFHDHYDYALKYPFDALQSPHSLDKLFDWFPWRLNARPTPAPVADAPFPALGNLINLRLKANPDDREMASLTALCREARRPGPENDLLEDSIDEGRFELDAFEPRRVNWKLLDGDGIRSTLLSNDEVDRADGPIKALVPLASHVLRSRVIILGVDGGSRHDRFDAATVAPDPISGALMHALVAKSSAEPVQENASIAFSIDALVGIAFVTLWAATVVLLARVAQRSRLPSTFGWLAAAMPIVLALGIGWVVTYALSPWLLEHWNLWSNPAYVLGGLVLHAYLEAWRENWPDVKVHHRHLPDFSFGATKLARWRWSSDDAVIATFCGAIAITGIALLFSHREKHGHWAATAAAALFILSFVVHRRRKA